MVSPVLQFLHVDVEIKDSFCKTHGWTNVCPTMRNTEFVLGTATFPKVAKLPIFIAGNFQTKMQICVYLWGCFCTFDKVFEGDFRRASECTAVLLAEQFCLLWPLSWISVACCGLPRRHHSAYCAFVRKIGTLSKHNAVLARTSHTSFVSWDHAVIFGIFRSICDDAARLVAALLA